MMVIADEKRRLGALNRRWVVEQRSSANLVRLKFIQEMVAYFEAAVRVRSLLW